MCSEKDVKKTNLIFKLVSIKNFAYKLNNFELASRVFTPIFILLLIIFRIFNNSKNIMMSGAYREEKKLSNNS